jgi:hypothetical protein
MLHIWLAGTLACGSFLFAARAVPPPPDNAMEVSMMVLPRSQTHMSERAQHAPRETGETPTADQPAPVRESDLTLNQPDAPKTKGTTPKVTSKDRDRALRDLLKDDLLEDTPEGAVDRTASDPNSTTDDAVNATGLGVPTDPEYARYVSQIEALFRKNFHPLPSITAANPDLLTKVHIEVDPATGGVTGYEITGPSGNESYDRAAESAVQAVPTIPLPPERFRELLAGGYTIKFPTH